MGRGYFFKPALPRTHIFLFIKAQNMAITSTAPPGFVPGPPFWLPVLLIHSLQAVAFLLSLDSPSTLPPQVPGSCFYLESSSPQYIQVKINQILCNRYLYKSRIGSSKENNTKISRKKIGHKNECLFRIKT